MVSCQNFDLVAATLNSLELHSVVVVLDDKCQQQTLVTTATGISMAHSILKDGTFNINSRKFPLYHQFCCLEESYSEFLDIVRHTQATQHYLETFQQDHVCVPQSEPTDTQVH